MPRTCRLPTIAALALLLGACSSQGVDDDATLTIWAHHGKEAEVAVLERQVAAFEALHPGTTVEITFLPQQGYHSQVQAAGVAGRLPDLIEFDGPHMANLAWKGSLRELDSLASEGLRERLLPSLVDQGTWNGTWWCIGTFDSGLGLYVNRALLPDDVPIPDGIDAAWSVEDFTRLLTRLSAAERAQDADGAVLDLKLTESGEWWTYAFAPVLWSAGAGFVGPDAQATGTLDSPTAVAALGTVRDWIADGLVDPNTDGRAFLDGRVACAWSGHWDYPRFHAALGDDLALVPLPDFGQGPKTCQGSWAWGITPSCDQPQLAMAFIEFLLETEQVLAMTAANGAVPATHEAVAASSLYAADGPLHLFAAQLTAIARPRPVTPAYPTITDAFQQAMTSLRTDGDLAAALSEAAAAIDRDYADNRGYPSPE